jgi:hemerythrin-like domain-containing protein
MSDTTLQAALEKEHHQIDGGINSFIAEPADPAPLLQSMEALRRHIYLEEDFLFPPLREAGLVMPILVMIREHGDIWKAMNGVAELLDNNAPKDAVIEACRALLQLQETHNAKEEPIIYPQADLKLSFDVAARLQAYIDSSTLPEGWICQALE